LVTENETKLILGEIIMDPNARTFVVDKTLYGNVKKPYNLGLQTFSPYIALDTNETRAYFGTDAQQKVADAASGTTLEGIPVELPLDVKYVGNQYLSQLGVPPEQQEAAMAKWLALSQSTQASLVDQWAALDKSDVPAVTSFVQSVLATLS
jgi:hypothetical protein